MAGRLVSVEAVANGDASRHGHPIAVRIVFANPHDAHKCHHMRWEAVSLL